MNMRWHTEPRAMKTAVAGAVGADGGEANLTHCPPPPPQPAPPPLGNTGLGCTQLVCFVSALMYPPHLCPSTAVRKHPP